MRSVVPFEWRRLTSASVLMYRVNEAGQIVVQGNVPPFQPIEMASCFVWKMCTSGDEWVLRTVGAPSSMTRIKKTFGDMIKPASDKHAVDERIILTSIMCESGGRPTAARAEPARGKDPGYPGYTGSGNHDGDGFTDGARDAQDVAQNGGQDASYGLMQTLLSTAKGNAPQLFAGKDPSTWRDVLFVPQNAIEAGAAFYATFKPAVRTDPVASRFSAGAGGVYARTTNPWGALYYGETIITRFLAYWNDLVEVETPGAGTALVSFGVFALAMLLHAAHCIQG